MTVVSHSSGADHDVQQMTSYSYSYPHKSSYRRLDPPIRIADTWRNEPTNHLALYVHIPFCEMRCGFCNLFTQSQPGSDRLDRYLSALSRQVRIVRAELPLARIATFAIGGGTPTYLVPEELDRLLERIETAFRFSIRDVPTSVETSPETATSDRLKVLADRGVQRISIGIQSFIEAETQSFGRPQQTGLVYSALDIIRSLRIPVLNIDLIYGSQIQTRSSWEFSLRAALRFAPEEMYLYPLYIRPETGLARIGNRSAEHRIDLYRLARDLLLESGYRQISMRCFRRHSHATSDDEYTCQRDGMIGMGCGARSYTRQLHYSTRFAVTQAGVRAILDDWINQSDQELTLATHGIRLNEDEQRRRYLILSILQASGLSLEEYQRRFDSPATTDFPELLGLFERGWVDEVDGRIALTPVGLENSDVVGPLLYSESVRRRLREFVEL